MTKENEPLMKNPGDFIMCVNERKWMFQLLWIRDEIVAIILDITFAFGLLKNADGRHEMGRGKTTTRAADEAFSDRPSLLD